MMVLNEQNQSSWVVLTNIKSIQPVRKWYGFTHIYVDCDVQRGVSVLHKDIKVQLVYMAEDSFSVKFKEPDNNNEIMFCMVNINGVWRSTHECYTIKSHIDCDSLNVICTLFHAMDHLIQSD